jgi:peptide/nickel transport system ATP-binding protein
VDELFVRPQHHYTSGLLSASPTPGRHAGTHRLQEIPGLVPVLSEQPDACTFADRCAAATARCTSSRPRLDPAPVRAGLDGSDHVVACWHPRGDAPRQTPEDRP